MRVRLWAAIVLGSLAIGCASPVVSDSTFHVMVANDDGIDSPGILELARVLAGDPSYRVTVVAPAHQQSGVGHALTLRREVGVKSHDLLPEIAAWAVDATPASTVLLGITTLLKEDRPELVVSGINRGGNLGRSAWISGTVGAAREALFLGIPAVAFSLEVGGESGGPEFEAAARWAKPVIDAVRNAGLPPGVLLNVNIPEDPDAAVGYRLARMDLGPDAEDRFVETRHEGDVRFFKSRWRASESPDAGSDRAALAQGFVAITPLGLDQTEHRAMGVLQSTLAEIGDPASGPQAAGEEN